VTGIFAPLAARYAPRPDPRPEPRADSLRKMAVATSSAELAVPCASSLPAKPLTCEHCAAVPARKRTHG
jgi:hypothetical protein